MPSVAVFSYGTLRGDYSDAGDRWGVLRRTGGSWRHARVRGFQLYQESGCFYPFAFRTGNDADVITGTLLTWPSEEVSLGAVQECDCIESYDPEYPEAGLYLRFEGEVEPVSSDGVVSGARVPALIYHQRMGSREGVRHFPDGDWWAEMPAAQNRFILSTVAAPSSPAEKESDDRGAIKTVGDAFRRARARFDDSDSDGDGDGDGDSDSDGDEDIDIPEEELQKQLKRQRAVQKVVKIILQENAADGFPLAELADRLDSKLQAQAAQVSPALSATEAMATTVPIATWMQFFLGVSEEDLIYERRDELFRDGAFVHATTGQRWPAGTFERPSVRDLFGHVQTMPAIGVKRDVPLNVVDSVDIGVLQAQLSTEQRAMVQIASNFNCLEMGSTLGRPECGYLVEGYASDSTQGPAATFGVPAAALLRAHYPFYDQARPPMEWGQTSRRQVELLEDVTQWFGENVPNGKVILSGAEDPNVPPDHVASRIQVGVHSDAEVVFGRSRQCGVLDLVPEPRPLIDQAIVASVPWRLTRDQGPQQKQLEDVTRSALRAAYHGTYLAAVARGRKLLLLTLVGSAAFMNPMDMVLEELAAAHMQWAGHPASCLEEVRICVFARGGAPSIQSALERLAPQVQSRATFAVEHTEEDAGEAPAQ